MYINHLKKIHNSYYNKINIEPIEDKFKKEIGTTIEINQLDNIEFFIKRTEKDFSSNKEKINKLIDKNQIILNNQTLNAKKIILKLL